MTKIKLFGCNLIVFKPKGVKLYKNMSDCDKLIQEACNFTLPASESAEVGKCNKVMGEFREGTEKCKTTPTNCSCWIAMEKDIQGVKKCNIGLYEQT